MARLGMVVDTKGCISCNACSMACKIENNLPDGVWWTQARTEGGARRDTPAGTYPNLSMRSYTFACQHCANPACVEVCPVGATYKDEATGIVMQDVDVCIGCQACMSACPYEGVRTYLDEEPAYLVGFAVGDPEAAPHKQATVEKCRFCAHRVARGEQPACIEVCPARARFFGDLDDPTSEVAQLLAERESYQLLPEEGTSPSVYFLS